MKMRRGLQGLVMVLVVWLSYILLTTAGAQVCQFDFYGDGDVDGLDLVQFLSQFDAEDLEFVAGEYSRSDCAVFSLYPEDVDFGLAADEQQGGGGLVGETVRILNGNTIEYRTDLSFASPHSFGLGFSATYNSQSGTLGALGFGWTHSYNLSLVTDFYFSGKSYLKIVDETGRGVYFEQETADMYRGAFHEKTYVTLDTTDYVWHRLDGSRYGFSESGKLVWIEDEKSNRLEISYDEQNRLETVKDAAGDRVLTVNYYDASNLIASISGPVTLAVAGGIWVRFFYDEAQNLDLVTYADESGIDYGYTDPEDEHNLTEKRNKAGHLISTWSYDNQDRCEANFSRRGRGGSIKYFSDARVKVTDAYDVVRTYSIDNAGGRKRVFAMEGPAGAPYTDSNAIGWDYDEQMNLVELRHAIATIDQYLDHDTRGNPWTVVLTAGEPEARTVTYTYHPDMNAVLTRTEPSLLGVGSKVTIWDYDDDYDTTPNEHPTNLVSRIVEQGYTKNTVGRTVPYEYVTTYDYNAQGQVLTIDGPRTDVIDVTSFIYYINRDLESVTYPLIGAGYFDNYDNAGQPGRVSDVNAQSTQFTYDGRGRIISFTHNADSSTATTTYINGQLDTIRDEDGVTRGYEYESVNGHLYRTYDVENNYVQHLYDARGNLAEKSTNDSTGRRYSRKRWNYLGPDIKGKLWKEINFDDTYTEYRYFSDGNLKSKTDPENRISEYGYDAFNRLKTVMQTHKIARDTITSYAYDEHGNLASVTDAEDHRTTYTYDDMGRVIKIQSPDTGKTTQTYDEAGNLIQKTDANGKTIRYVYDALNRLTTIDFSLDPDITYSYDQGLNGKGHRTGMTDALGHTTFTFDSRSRLVGKTSSVSGKDYALSRVFTPGNRLDLITCPTGRTVDSIRNSSTGKIEKILTTFYSTTKTLVDNLAYNPFGAAKSMVTGSGGSVNNRQSECACLEVANPGTAMEQVYTYYYDGNLDTITGTNSPWFNRDFDYDSLHRLERVTDDHGTIEYEYDKIGNRLSRKINGETDTYSYFTGTNRLDQISGTNLMSFAYDDNGNTTGITGSDNWDLICNQNNRLIQIKKNGNTIANYTYNGLGQRALKDAGGAITVFHYDFDGNIIAESQTDGTFITEYIYRGTTRMAQVDSSTGVFSYFENNYLGTPLLMTDENGNVIWEARYKPFGETDIFRNLPVVNNFRFAGQYYDSETGLHYNYHRYYDPKTGRYLTPDPIGLLGGINLFSYADNNPINLTDPFGLQSATGTLTGPFPLIYYKTPEMIEADKNIANALWKWMVTHYNPDAYLAVAYRYLKSHWGEDSCFLMGKEPEITQAPPWNLGPLKGAPSLPYPGANIGSADPNLPPPPKPPKPHKTFWEKIKFFIKEGAKRIPWILNP